MYTNVETALITNLDAIWKKAFCHSLKEWPFLIIRFQQAFCSFQAFDEYDGNDRIVSETGVTALGSAVVAEGMDFAKLADLFPIDVLQNIQAASGLSRTEISTVCGGVLALVHTPMVEILLCSEKGSQLTSNLANEREA